MVYVEVYVEVFAHAIWIDLVAQLEVIVRSVMRDSPCQDLLQALG